MNEYVGPANSIHGSSDGVIISAHDYGGRGPTIIFCHATGFHGRYWDPICKQLSSDFHCVSLDFRGHGNSSLPLGTSLSWVGMAEDLLSVVDQLDLDPALAVGHSMGASSILLAEQISYFANDFYWEEFKGWDSCGFCKKKKRDFCISRRSIPTVCLKTAIFISRFRCIMGVRQLWI